MEVPDPDAPLEAFIAPARERSEVWRLVVGVLLAAACWLLAVAAGFLLLHPLAGTLPGRAALVGYLASFGVLILGLALALRLLHGRRLASLVGPGGARPREVALGAAVVTVVAAAGLGLLFAVSPPARHADPLDWARWLPFALPAILVQVTAEELAFRGYLMQGLAARFRARAVWLGVPALVFGMLHWNPTEFGENAWLVAASAAVAGLLLGDVTARTGNLSLAIGLHFANNAAALLIVALPSPLAALSLYVYPVDPADAAAIRLLLLLDLVLVLVAWALWRTWHRSGRRV